MSKYIKADELSRAKFHPLPHTHIVPADIKDAEVYERGWNDAIDAIIENAPTADVCENVHAHWIHERLISTGGGSYPVVRCSACQWQYPMSETRFCPNCGAVMEERGTE